MLINLSNHPYALWSEEQKIAATFYGETVDLSFPAVDPSGDEAYIAELANSYFEKIIVISKSNDFSDLTVHLMGEMTFVYNLLALLQEAGIRSVASTTDRQNKDLGNGQKESQFQFVRFRKYY